MNETPVIGTPVTFDQRDILYRDKFNTADGMNRRWVKIRDTDPEYPEKEVAGFLIGKRTFSNGHFEPARTYRGYEGFWDGDSSSYAIVETLQVYIIAESLYNRPMFVRVEDVTIS